ncbi:DUF6599 family protein, partial [Thermodesulfobacteriota bacterium]
KKPSHDQTFIEVSVYDMGNPANAFGVFSAERPDEIFPMALGREGYRSEASLFIRKGNYYIRMIASRDDSRIRKITLELANKLTDSLDDNKDRVWGLSALPKTGRAPGSTRFFRRNAMGLDFMQNTYTARYRKNGAFITVFLSQQSSADAARKTVLKYAKYARRFGESVSNITRDGVTITLCDMDGSYDAIFQKENLVSGATAVRDRHAALDFAHEFFRLLRSNTP